MSLKKETKIERILDATQAAEFFHTLGMAIAWAGDDKLAEFGLPLGDFEKIKLSIKREGAVYILKAKVRKTEPAMVAAEETPGSAATDKPPYKAVKKRLKGTFSELKKLLTQDAQEAPPSAETVRRFLDDSHLMTTYPGQGDEHYEHYARCCQEFEKAFASGNLEAMRSTLAAVELRKKACHAHYK